MDTQDEINQLSVISFMTLAGQLTHKQPSNQCAQSSDSQLTMVATYAANTLKTRAQQQRTAAVSGPVSRIDFRS